MTSKQVTQWKCDWCGKRKLSASHMAKHERHCTMNPGRVCRVCKMVEGVQQPMEVLVALLPRYSKEAWTGWSDEEDMVTRSEKARQELAAVMPKLRGVTANCPACIMAALRQAGIPVWCADGFDFKKEMEAIWRVINDAQVAACDYGY